MSSPSKEQSSDSLVPRSSSNAGLGRWPVCHGKTNSLQPGLLPHLSSSRVMLSFGSLEMQGNSHPKGWEGLDTINQSELLLQNFAGWFFFQSPFLGKGKERQEQGPRKQTVLTRTWKKREDKEISTNGKSLFHCNHCYTKGSDPIRTFHISIHLPVQVYLRTVEDLVTDPSPCTAQSWRKTLKLVRFFI